MIMNVNAASTDEMGRFTLPQFFGASKVSVADKAPDYSRQLVMTGTKPTANPQQTIELDGKNETEEINFREVD